MARYLIALATVASLVACAGEPAATPSPRAPTREVPTATPSPSQDREVPTARPALDGSIPVEDFAAYVDQEDPPWGRSPLRSSLEFVGHDQPEATVTTITERTDYLAGAGPAIVVLTHSGLGDDSVLAVRYVLRFESREEGTWRLVSARWTQRCAPGRGHQRFNLEPCI